MQCVLSYSSRQNARSLQAIVDDGVVKEYSLRIFSLIVGPFFLGGSSSHALASGRVYLANGAAA